MTALHAWRALRRAACFPLVLLVATSAALGCPFCGVVGQSLAQRRDEAAAVAVGEPEADSVTVAAGMQLQRFAIRQMLRGAQEGFDDSVTARVAAPVTGTAILFRQPGDDGQAPRWSAVAADEAVLGYVASAPAWNDEPAERLRWYARRLEHPDPTIAEDAFTEFGLAPYAAVRAASDAFDADRLRQWVNEPGIDQRRRGFYGLALGVTAAGAPEAAERAASLAVLRDAIAAPASDFRAGFDGLLGGLFVAEGAAALTTCERAGLFAPTARPADQKHLLAALRFAWEELAASVPREKVAAATARLLASPATAADAAIDLARYAAWDHAADVAALWDRLGGDDPLVRRAVAGYLAACPKPEAQQLLATIRSADPQRLDAALEAARLPK